MADNIELHVKVQMCGNCNPFYDVKQLLEKMKSIDQQLIYVFSGEECDIILTINGCPVACRHSPDFDGPKIMVSGFNVNDIEVPENELASHIVSLLEKYKGKKI